MEMGWTLERTKATVGQSIVQIASKERENFRRTSEQKMAE